MSRAPAGWPIVLALLASSVISASSIGLAQAKPPSLGVVSQARLDERDFTRMQHGGVQTLRFLLWWGGAEPEPGVYDWKETDRLALLAARHRIELLPFIWGSPAWMYGDGTRPPLASIDDRNAWQDFLTALVKRYGHGGELWSQAAPTAPIRRWQIWNEPNFDFYWAPPIDPAGYADLLALSASAVRAADPRAELVAAGVAPVAAGMPWTTFLTRFYRVPGVGEQFDYMALHPYAARVRVLLAEVAQARAIMAAAGDARKALAITELGWASGPRGSAPLVVGRKGQARRLRRALTKLGEYPRRQVSDVQWYAWQDAREGEYLCTFCRTAGLFGLGGRPKPAWDAFKRVAAADGE